MARRLVPVIYYNVGDGFLMNDGSLFMVVEIDQNKQTYLLKARNNVRRLVHQDYLFDRVKHGIIKYLGKKMEGDVDEGSGKF